MTKSKRSPNLKNPSDIKSIVNEVLPKYRRLDSILFMLQPRKVTTKKL